MAYQMDFFAGVESKVLAAVGSKVKYPAYIFVRDNEASETGRLAFVDQNNQLKFIRGENKQQVVNVVELPSVGELDVLYVKDGIVYVWTGVEFKPQFVDHTAELEALNDKIILIGTKIDELDQTDAELSAKDVELEAKITELVAKDNELVSKDGEFEAKLAKLEGKDSELDAKDAELAGQIEALDKKIDALEIPQECICKPIKYEVKDVPVGTIVDCREDEIRIMCPQGTEFVKQSVGSGGDPDCYYFTLRTYAPDEAVIGYREHLGDKVDAEVLTDLKTDEYGRRYQPTWLALARCDADGAWTYYGANSTKEHYIGWDYQIDWYDANGVMIASDAVRINLSNEECHSTIEPYYVHGVQTDVEGLIAQIKDLEAQVKTLEENSMTFVELD